MEILNLITELNMGRGSSSGRSKGLANKAKVNPVKSKVTVFKSIMSALKQGHFGQTFSTPKSNRLYVITKHKWGKSNQQKVGDRVAKGFSAGDKPSSFSDVKKYAQKTLMRHAKKSGADFSPPKIGDKSSVIEGIQRLWRKLNSSKFIDKAAIDKAESEKYSQNTKKIRRKLLSGMSRSMFKAKKDFDGMKKDAIQYQIRNPKDPSNN